MNKKSEHHIVQHAPITVPELVPPDVPRVRRGTLPASLLEVRTTPPFRLKGGPLAASSLDTDELLEEITHPTCSNEERLEMAVELAKRVRHLLPSLQSLQVSDPVRKRLDTLLPTVDFLLDTAIDTYREAGVSAGQNLLVDVKSLLSRLRSVAG